jgi:D-citramalate synthase
MSDRKIKIFDTTLRDGEQTNNVSFTPDEKLIFSEIMLSTFGVDYLEIGSCRVSEKEFDAVSKISQWAIENNFHHKISVLSFVDFNKSIDWLLQTECRSINLLTKGSRKHCEIQLKKSHQDHLNDIEKTIEYATKHNVKYRIYLEDWSRGFEDSPEYVFKMCEFLNKLPHDGIILCDTIGILSPWKTQEYVSKMVREFQKTEFHIHCHNDYGLANVNSLFAVQNGIQCVHGSINGLGERAGNTNLIEFVIALKDHLGIDLIIPENELTNISNIIERFSGKKVSHNAPIMGRDVFTQTAGIHADGDSKGDLYKSNLSAERFNRNIQYSLGKMSGKGNLEMNLKNTGIHLTNEQKQLVLSRIVEMADAKKIITFDDLPFIISDVIGSEVIKKDFEVLECIITSSSHLKPVANIKIRYKNVEYTECASGNGGYNAFMNALSKISEKSDLFIPQLIDFEVTIPKGGHTNALVETVIIWQDGVRTSGVLGDQVMASIRATEKAINIFISRK